MDKPKRKRLNIELDELTHQAIKIKAAERNITIRKLIVRIIIEALKKDAQYH